MKILIRDESTELFCRTLDIWSSDFDEAMAFDSVMDAAMFCASHELRGFQLIVHHRRNAAVQYPIIQTDQVTHFPFC